jgi:hypothetical protein
MTRSPIDPVAPRTAIRMSCGLPENGHSAYILQGNLFHDFLEESTSIAFFKDFGLTKKNRKADSSL